MRLVYALVAALTLAACGLGGQGRAADPELDALFVRLQAAPDPAAAAPIEQAILQRWRSTVSPTADILLDRARNAEAAGQSDMAIGFLDQASHIEPDHAETWLMRANIAYGAADYAGAVAAILEAHEREPRHFVALAYLGRIYEELGQNSQALDAFRAALAVHPNYQPALDGARRLEPSVEGRDA